MNWPKSKSGTRTIPLASPAVQALREWKLKSGNSNGLVFTTSEGKDIALEMMRRNLAKACVAARVFNEWGEPKYTGMHSFAPFQHKLAHQPH